MYGGKGAAPLRRGRASYLPVVSGLLGGVGLMPIVAIYSPEQSNRRARQFQLISRVPCADLSNGGSRNAQARAGAVPVLLGTSSDPSVSSSWSSLHMARLRVPNSRQP